MKEEKLEQLRNVFKNIVTHIYFNSYDKVKKVENMRIGELEERYIDNKVNELLCEVKIRINNK